MFFCFVYVSMVAYIRFLNILNFKRINKKSVLTPIFSRTIMRLQRQNGGVDLEKCMQSCELAVGHGFVFLYGVR